MTEGAPIAEFPDRSRLDRILAVVVAIVFTVVILATVAATAYVAHETTIIRDTQIENTRVAACQTKAFAAVLKDAKLALQGDRNARDYAVAPKC